MMRKPFFISLILAGFFLFFESGLRLSVFSWKTYPESREYSRQSLDKFVEYVSAYFFDKGYSYEEGALLGKRLSSYPSVEDPSMLQVKLALPEGFKSGIISLKLASKSDFSIDYSFNRQDWVRVNYPGFGVQTTYVLRLGSPGQGEDSVYFQFNPSKKEDLNIKFNGFEFVSSVIPDKEEFGLMFFPDYEVDYDGKVITQEAIYYDSRGFKENR